MAFLEYLTYFLVGYSILTMSLYLLSYLVPAAAFGARSLAAYISVIICASFGALVAIVLRVLGQEQISQWACARVFKYVMLATTGITFEIIDPHGWLDNMRPAIFVGNHQTELDVLMLGCMFPKYCSVTAKRSLKNVPFLGWFMSLSGTIFIDRQNAKDAREAMMGAAEEIKKRRQSVYMFPEGTRSYSKDPTLLPFKKGAFHLAVQAGAPIVPVVAANYSHILYIKGLVFKAGKIPLRVLDPIPTTGLSPADVDELARTTRERMLKEHVRLTEMVQNRSIAMPASANSSNSNGVVKASGAEATLS